MRAWVIWIVAAAIGGFAYAQPVSWGMFTDEVIASLKSEGIATCVRRLDEGGFSFGPDETDCDVFRVFTENQYKAYLLDPENKSIYIDKLTTLAQDVVASSADEESYPPDYMESLIVIVRPETYGSELGVDAPKDMTSRPLAGSYRIFLAFDFPDKLMVTGLKGIPFAGLSEDDLFELAAENTRKRMGAVSRTPDMGVTVVHSEGSLSPSLLALPETCTEETPGYYALMLDGFTYAEVPEGAPEAVTQLARIGMYNLIWEKRGYDTLLHCSGGAWVAADMQALAE